MFKLIFIWLSKNYWRFSPMNLYEKFERRNFDKRYGVETKMDVQLAALQIDSPNKLRGKRYHATPPLSFKRVLYRLKINFPEFTFIDIGSGKGRTLLLASELSFRRVLGVEFGMELHLQAVRNILSHQYESCANIESVYMDAIKFKFPDGPLVIYFFNPFDGVVLNEVLTNIVRASQESNRRIYIIYLFLENEEVFKKFKSITPLFSWRRFDVYTCNPL